MTNQSEEQRIGKIETDIAVINTKIDGIGQSLQGIHTAMTQQTEILGKFIAYQQKQDHLSEAHDALKKDYSITKDMLVGRMGWLRGAFAVGTFCIAMVMGMATFIVKEKVDVLQSVADKVAAIELDLSLMK